MTFDVQSPFEHDGERYDPGDEFDDMTEAEARGAGLVPQVLAPQHQAAQSTGSGTKDDESKDESKKDA